MAAPIHFTDDGFSGTKFDRPGFSSLMRAVAANRIDTIVTKDVSRLGRDYLTVGYVMEYLRQRNVRVISLGDNIDTAKGEDDFLAIRNLINEWHVRDTSRKIHTVLKAKGQSGRRLANVSPYGYVNDQNNKDHWLIDPEAAAVVRRIFQMAVDGLNPSAIAKILKSEKVELPGVHLERIRQGESSRYRAAKDPYNWTRKTVQRILTRREYTGCTVNFKSSKHYKDKRSHQLPKDRWLVFENTQEAIISRETFEAVLQCLEERRTKSGQNREEYRSSMLSQDNGGVPADHPLLNYVRCADCGSKMYFRPGRRIDDSYPNAAFVCVSYFKRPYGTYCSSSHHVKILVIEEALRAELLRLKNAVLSNGVSALEQKPSLPREKRQMALRIEEIKAALQKHFEDYACNRITADRYEELSEACEKELEALKRTMEADSTRRTAPVVDSEEYRQFLLNYDPAAEIDYRTLSRYLDHINVFEREKKRVRVSPQKIRIVMKHF